MKLCKIIGVLTALLLISLFLFFPAGKKSSAIVVASTPKTEHAAQIPVAGSKEFSAQFRKRIQEVKPLTKEEDFRKSMDIIQTAVTQFKENQQKRKEHVAPTLDLMLENGASIYTDKNKTTDKLSTYRKLKVGDEFPGRSGTKIVDIMDSDKDQKGNFRRIATMTVPKEKIIYRIEAEVAVDTDGSEYVFEQRVANAKRITILAKEGVNASKIKELAKELGYQVSEPTLDSIYVATIDDLKVSSVSNAIDAFNEHDDIVWLANQDGLSLDFSGPVYPNDPMFSPIGVRKGTEAFRFPNPPINPGVNKPSGFEPFNLAVFWPLGDEVNGLDQKTDDLANPKVDYYDISLADLKAKRDAATAPKIKAYFVGLIKEYEKLDPYKFHPAVGKWDLNVDIDWLRYIMAYNAANPLCTSCWKLPEAPNEWKIIPPDVQNIDIDAPEAWEIRTSTTYYDQEEAKFHNGIVAVIDTGIDYRHEDLVDNMWVNEAEAKGQAGVDDDDNGYIDDIYGIDPVNEPENGTWVPKDKRGLPVNDPNPDGPMDDLLHGTHVAGIIGARGNNGIGTVGVCWSVKLMALKAGSGISLATVDQLRCMEYARKEGATVCNMSYGGWDAAPGDPVRLAGFENLRRKGIICAVAAGNDDDPIPRPSDGFLTYPASYPSDNIVAVGATSATGQRAIYSNHNAPGASNIDIGAPGGSGIVAFENGMNAGADGKSPQRQGLNPYPQQPSPPTTGDLNWSIFSTFPLVKDANGDTAFTGNNKVDEYMAIDGTSMATPEVAGALALMVAESPKKSYKKIIKVLLDTAEQDPRLFSHPPKPEDQISGPFSAWNTGGRLNIGRALIFLHNEKVVEETNADLTVVNSTDGVYADKVLISWPLVSGYPVDFYQVWRSPSPLVKDARPIATIPVKAFANGLSFGYYYDRDTGRQEKDRTLFVKTGLKISLPAGSTELIQNHTEYDYNGPELGVDDKYSQYYYWVRTISDAKFDINLPLQYPNADKDNRRLASYAISPWSNSNPGHRKAPLPAPAQVKASDKTSEDQIALQWSVVKGASAFYVYRGDDASKEHAELVAIVPGQQYNFLDKSNAFIARAPAGTIQYIGQEFNNASASRFGRVAGVAGIEPGKVYYYWVRTEAEAYARTGDKSLKRILSPQYSLPGHGSTNLDASKPPIGEIKDLRASLNMFTDKIELHWSHVYKATDYEVWRSETPNRDDAIKLVDVIRTNASFVLDNKYTDKANDQEGLLPRLTPGWWPAVGPYPVPPFGTNQVTIHAAPTQRNWPTYRANPDEYILGADGIYGHPLELEKDYWYWVRPIQDERTDEGAVVPSPTDAPDPIRRWEQSLDRSKQDSRLDNTNSSQWKWVTGEFSNSAKGRRLRAPAPGMNVQVQVGFDMGGNLVTGDSGQGGGTSVNSLSSVLVSKMHGADYRFGSKTNGTAVRMKNVRGTSIFSTLSKSSFREVSSFSMNYKVPHKESQFTFDYKFSEKKSGAEQMLVYVNGQLMWSKTPDASNVSNFVNSGQIDLIDFTDKTITIKFVFKTDSRTALKQTAWIDTILFADYQVKPSWYALSVPNENQLINNVIGTTGSKVTGLHSWERGRYKLNSSEVSLTPGVGYWVYLPAAYDKLKLTGSKAAGSALIIPESGWNFVGPLETVKVSDYSSQIEGTVWAWNARKSTYEPAGDTLVPNKAYWIYSK